MTISGSAHAALEEIIVSARKSDESLQSVPVAVSAFTADDLQSMNFTSTEQLTRSTPSLLIEPPAGGNSTAAKVTIRGQNQSDSLITLDPSVGWYLDDVYLARAYGTVASLFDAERIEVLKGPQGTLYGRNTTGGAVKIITTKAEVSSGLSGYVTGGIGNYDARKIGGAINIPLIDNALAARLVVLKDKADGFAHVELHGKNDPSVIVDPNAEAAFRNMEMYRLNITLAATDALSVQVGYEHSDLDISTLQKGTSPSVFGPAPTDLGFYKAALNHLPRSKTKADTANLTVDYDISDSLTTRFIFGWRKLDSKYDSDVDGSPVNWLSFNKPLVQKDEQYSYEWQIAGNAAQEQLDWIAGIYYFDEDGLDESNSGGVLNGGLNNKVYGRANKNESKSIFFNGTLHLTDRLNFNGGLRYTKDDKPLYKINTYTDLDTDVFISCGLAPDTPNFNAAECSSNTGAKYEYVSWTVGFDYQIADDVMIYIKGSEASRSGGQQMRGAVGAASESFDPETATDVELGLKGQFWDNRIRLNADAYRTFYNDIQQTSLRISGGTPITVVANENRAVIDGIEVELTALVTDNFTITASGSMIDWRFKNLNSFGNHPVLPSTPDKQYSVRFDYVLPIVLGEMKFSANYAWRDGYYGNVGEGGRERAQLIPESNTDSLGLVGARISLDIERWGATVALWGNNLTDEKYQQSPLLIGDTGLVVQTIGEPRTYGLEATKRF
jgi:iron complex outermembrane receptor protein